MSSSEPFRFLSTALALAAALYLVLGLAARFVDPLGAFEGKATLCGPGVHALDSETAHIALLADHRARADVLLGSSRTQRGFDASAFAPHRATNLGIPQGSLDEMVALGHRALRNGRVKRLWIGLDYMSLRAVTAPSRFDDRPSGLPEWVDRWWRGAFSPDALRALGWLALRPRHCAAPPIDSDGMAIYAQRVPILPDATGRRTHLLPDAGDAVEARRITALAGLIAEARRRGVEPILVIGPYGPGLHASLERAGRAAIYRQARDRISAFARVHRLTLIAPPDFNIAQCRGGQCPMLDPIHFAPEMGRRIVAQYRAGSVVP